MGNEGGRERHSPPKKNGSKELMKEGRKKKKEGRRKGRKGGGKGWEKEE